MRLSVRLERIYGEPILRSLSWQLGLTYGASWSLTNYWSTNRIRRI